MKPVKEQLLDFFKDLIGSGKQFPTQTEMARFLGLPHTQATKLYNFLKGSDTQYTAVLDWLERLGGKVLPPDTEASREVCFVNAKAVNASGNATPISSEDYLAVPLVEEVGAGPGIIPQGELKSWFLVWRHQAAIQGKSDFIAVEIAKGSDSMEPTLCPKDIVLVSRADTSIVNGRMYLVLDPDGSGKIKRVSIKHLPDNKDYRITYYSDNTAEYEPEVFSLNDHFEGDWKRSIVGRVVWAWSDVTHK